MASKKKERLKNILEQMLDGRQTLGRLLNAIRLSEGVTMRVFSQRLMISPQRLNDIEKGRRYVEPKTAAMFAHHLSESESYFVKLCLQDQLRNSGIDYEVHLEAA